MVKTAALLLLLAVATSQVDPVGSTPTTTPAPPPTTTPAPPPTTTPAPPPTTTPAPPPTTTPAPHPTTTPAPHPTTTPAPPPTTTPAPPPTTTPAPHPTTTPAPPPTTTPAPPPTEVDIQICPLFYYGVEYRRLQVTIDADGNLTVCFINAPGETSQDCLLVLDAGETVQSQKVFPDSLTVPIVSNKQSSCSVTLRTYRSTIGLVSLVLLKFEQQTVMKTTVLDKYNMGDLIVSTTVNSSNVDSWTWPDSQVRGTTYVELSGCRHSGSVFGSDSVMEMRENCTLLVCDASAVIQEVYECGDLEVCGSDNICVLPPMVCTVTGFSIIDVFGRHLPVQDRCGYSLMKPEGGVGFNLMAVFGERRRKDVPLLDHLVIALNGVSIRLGQSGRVTVGSQTLELSATSQLVQGVALSKDESGITAVLPPSVSNMTVSFDGNTAHVSGLNEAVMGLCGNTMDPSPATPPDQKREPSVSAAGCTVHHTDDPDSTIDCIIATERCNSLDHALFSACHDVIDPEPFITACKKLTCLYPMVDGLNCQFLEAYAESCFLKGNITVDWRAQTGCPVRKAFCPEYCSDHEFCGRSYGERHCLCRATFASKYKPTGSLGDPTVCTENSATLTLAGCLLREDGIDYSTLELIDPDCKGDMDEETHMVAFTFNSSNTCGTEVVQNETHLTYKNAVVLHNSSRGVITRKSQFHLDFSCYYTMPEERSVSFRILDSSVVKEIISDVWNYTLMMNAYTDSSLINPVESDTEIHLDQPVWVQLKTEGLDEHLVAIVTDSCWATSRTSPDSSPRYDLVTDGCPNPADPSVSVMANGMGTSNVVSFKMFQFTGEPNEVYLHCKLKLCPTMGQTCTPSCGRRGVRRRRALRTRYADGPAALITMAWNN